jgi:hypothetical protein
MSDPTPPPANEGRPDSPLGQLLAYVRAATKARSEPEVPGVPQDPDELPSVRRFRQAWDGMRLLDQVDQAVASKPANAGPLNSHVLVLQSLDLMRGLSPDYLRGFVSALETLQWLEQARDQLPRAPERSGPAGKVVRRPRKAK